MAMWVKICGITRVEDAAAAIEAGADAIGINFWPNSRRFCKNDVARSIIAIVPAEVIVFGVFVNTSREAIAATIKEVGIGGIQLHGNEPAEFAEGWHLPTIRAISATSRAAISAAIEDRDLSVMARSAGYRLLVDHGSGGGSGKVIEDALLEGQDLSDEILAGGLTPLNVADRVSRFHPYGVDTAGGVESSPGIKDHEAIGRFVREAHAGETEDWL